MTHRGSSKTSISIYCWFFQVVVVWGLVSVVVWRSLIPKKPTFTIADVYIATLNSTNSMLHRREVITNTSLVFNLQVSNPNKGMGIYYNEIYITLYMRDVGIGTKSIPAFYQPHKKSFRYDVPIDAGRQFRRGIGNGFVDLRLVLETAVKYQIFRWKTKSRQMVLEASVTIDPRGTILGEKNIKLHQIRS